MPDQVLEVQYKVTTTGDREAIEKAQQYRAEVDAIKKSLDEMSKVAGVHLQEASKIVTEKAITSIKAATPRDQIGQISKEDLAKQQAAIQRYVQQMNQAYAEVTKEYAGQVAARGALNKQEADTAKKLAKEAANAIKQAEKEKTDAAKKAIKDVSGEAKTGGATIKDFFKSILMGFGIGGGFMMVTQIVRSLANYLKEAAQAGYEFAKSMFQLSAGVNVMRRSGIDITVKDVVGNIIKLREEFGMFSTIELVKGTSALLNLTRDFGLTKEKVFELQDAIVKLAIINGRAMDEVQRTVALALSSGYTEGLQRLGVSINRVTIAQKAMAMGFTAKPNYLTLTEVQRSAATTALILEKTAKYEDDLKEYMKTLPGIVDAGTASFKNLKTAVGQATLPIQALFMKILGGAANAATRILTEAIPKLISNFISTFAPQAFIIGQLWEVITGKRALKDMSWKEAMDEAEELAKRITEILSGVFTLPAPEINDEELEKSRKELGDKIRQVYDDLEEAQLDFNDKSAELEEDHIEKLKEIDADGVEKLAEIWSDYQDKLLDIQKDLDQAITDHKTDYYRGLEDLNTDTSQKIEDANRKYHDDELKAEKDYQEKMRRLREEFLFDLEDALRARDAIQVLRLIRRYNLDKSQAQREKESDTQDRKKDYQRELADIRKQEAQKRKDLKIALDRQIADAELAAQRKREDALKAYKEAQQDAADNLKKLKEEEDKNYAERQKELEKNLKDRQNKILKAFAKEIQTTGTSLDTLAKVFSKYFASKGIISKYIDQYLAIINDAATKTQEDVQKMEEALSKLEKLSSSTTSSSATGSEPKNAGTYASGGSYFATRPTTATFGEAGPELATFTPLNQIKSSSINPSANLGNSGGIAKIELWLSPDLEARIIDSTLGQAARIFTDVTRTR